MVAFLLGHLYLIGVEFGEDQRTNNVKTHAQKRLDYILLKFSTNYSTLNSEQNLAYKCIKSRNQQTCTSDNHNQIKKGMIYSDTSLWSC